MQVILDFSFVSPGQSAPIGGGKKGEFRDWTIIILTISEQSKVDGVVCTRPSLNFTLRTIRLGFACPMYQTYF